MKNSQLIHGRTNEPSLVKGSTKTKTNKQKNTLQLGGATMLLKLHNTRASGHNTQSWFANHPNVQIHEHVHMFPLSGLVSSSSFWWELNIVFY